VSRHWRCDTRFWDWFPGRADLGDDYRRQVSPETTITPTPPRGAGTAPLPPAESSHDPSSPC